MSLLVLFGVLTISGSGGCELKFSNSDLNLIEKYFEAESLVFVEDTEDVGLVSRVKRLRTLTFVTFLNSSYLEEILANNVTQLKLLQRKTTIVTKEDLNLTSLVNKDINTQDLYIPVSSKVFFVQSTPETVIKRVYNLKRGVNATVTIPDWNETTTKRMDFQGLPMNMLFLTPRQNCNKMHTQRLLKKLECVHWDFIEAMGDALNFRVNPVECVEKKFPFSFPNGSESEIFLKLRHKKVEFASIGYIVSARIWRDFLDFIFPTFHVKSRMYLKQRKLRGRWASYLKPLANSVWWGILVFVILFGVLLFVFEKLLFSALKFDSKSVMELAGSILKALQVFCNQAIPDLTAFYSIRMIYFFEFFVVLVFYQAYCGYLVSSLTVVASLFPFLDLNGFFAHPQYRLMVLQKGFHQFYFREIIGKGPREYLLPRHELPETIQEAVDKLCADPHLAFTEFREDLLDFETLSCKIVELPTPVLRLFVGIVMPSGTPLKEFLKRELFRLKSAGIVKKYGSQLSSQADFQDKRSGDEFSSVSMSHIFPAFIFLYVGIFLSVGVWVLEMMFSYGKKRIAKFVKKRKN